MNTRSGQHRWMFNSLEAAKQYLRNSYESLREDQVLPCKSVAEVLLCPNEPAAIVSPVVRYREENAERISKEARTVTELGEAFEWTANESTQHYPDTRYIKQCYPIAVLASNDEDYCELLQRCVRPPDRMHDAQLYFSTGCAFTGWHFDGSPNAVTVMSQLQQGEKLWWLAKNRRAGRRLQSRKTAYSLIEMGTRSEGQDAHRCHLV